MYNTGVASTSCFRWKSTMIFSDKLVVYLELYFSIAILFNYFRMPCITIVWILQLGLFWDQRFTMVTPQYFFLSLVSILIIGVFLCLKAYVTHFVLCLVFLRLFSTYWGLLGKFPRVNQWLLSPVDLHQVEGDILCKQVEILALASHLDLCTP